ncbi:gamma-glutamyl-gamma-aminobutyrate hydrolase family protein [Atopobium fossor]|uniref:gamma-glutamyl-gamma-aminobutyrate hydrolase family protein n=1 Tax=Atopobium fossor TaxID=39487 RepID=UPI00040F27B6|nr:gamma-glutamyl-gamma-aminobutyrate hydrolase family protein [Atopobium fossor]
MDTAYDFAPIIGITSRPGEEGHTWINQRYADCVIAAGGIPVVLPLAEQGPAMVSRLLDLVDGLLLTGGGDIAAESFNGNVYEPYSVAEILFTDAIRDRMEEALCAEAWKRNLPILAICRGMQLLNVSRGGRMVRDVSEQPNITASSQTHVAPPFDMPCHAVTLDKNSKLAGIYNSTRLGVNSYHHQAISAPGEGITFVGWATDGTPEALECPEKDFVVGVQWHPEILGTQPELFEAFVVAATTYKKQ